jgi:nucleoside-diphosphate-sugar epimerase
MKVFVTGASGYIGMAVTKELLSAGHSVIGLARSDESAVAIAAAGAEVLHGELDKLDSIKEGADKAEGIIHLAYMHDFSDIQRGGEADLKAVQAIADVIKDTNKVFIGTSGTLIAGHIEGRAITEEDPGQEGARREDVESLTLDMANQGIRSAFVRLSPTVHSDLDKHGFMPALINIAREHGVSAYVGEGTNRWPAVHLSDAALLFRLALEKVRAGTRLHGVGEEGIEFKDIAKAIGDHLNVPVTSIDADKATDHFGFLGALVSMDNPASSKLTQEWLDWQPKGPKLLEDLAQDFYFDEAI